MMYRTKTYIAADWEGDKNAVEQLYKWNESKYWELSFHDAHEMTQARDTSLNCSIKRSLASRLDASKTFVLIVGDNTKDLKSGSCQYCTHYYAFLQQCLKDHPVDLRSYIEYECDKAIKDGLQIIVLYNFTAVYKWKCPDVIKDHGIHVPMITMDDNGKYVWDYQSVKNAFEWIKTHTCK